MKRFGANYIFPVCGPPIRNGIVETNNTGEILRIIETDSVFREIHSTQFFNGVIVPGFINAHCHLELSHLKGLKVKKPGIAGFIEAVTEQRESSQENISKSIYDAINQAYTSGTVAVADICNSASTLPHKQKSELFFHNFIELFGINPDVAEKTFGHGLNVYYEFSKHYPESTSLTPHSTYSLSEKLWEIISEHLNEKDGKIVSIHYGESMAEYEFLATGSGPLYHRYKNSNLPFIAPAGKSPAIVITSYLPNKVQALLVHNTFASTEELLSLNRWFDSLTLVACPESNLLIENAIPPLDKFEANGLNIAIGTDSLASTSSLSMLHQIMIILNHFPAIDFQTVLRWATINGAKALNIDNMYGTLGIGKKPGLVLVDHFDFTKMRPTEKSVAKRLI
ncbi:MAG: amidohydrolase family protein [Tenuifilum sp.]|uniref:amidohydrolase family protein n=1 Tax=Tenuifilum sp. TaxID=2760880 RepID=UPI002C91E76F|nr:amidohydrolase family protein [Tenuifilum sp.]